MTEKIYEFGSVIDRLEIIQHIILPRLMAIIYKPDVNIDYVRKEIDTIQDVIDDIQVLIL